MIRRFALRIGVSYVYGLANFLAGVALGCAWTGFLIGAHILPHH